MSWADEINDMARDIAAPGVGDDFYEQLEDDRDPAEYVPEFGEVADPYAVEMELLDLPHTACTSYFCPKHGERNLLTAQIDEAKDRRDDQAVEDAGL